jgi:Flp pilus assembly pilin Flp
MTALQVWMQSKWQTFRDETGASMVEYALLVVLIAIVAIVAVALAGRSVSTTFADIATHLTP